MFRELRHRSTPRPRGPREQPAPRTSLRRVLITIPVLLALSVFVFLLIRLVPGDPVRTMLGFRATPENVATIREELGLDRPLLDPVRQWLGGLFHGDFGEDYVSRRPALVAARQRLPVTLELTFLAMGLARRSSASRSACMAASRGGAGGADGRVRHRRDQHPRLLARHHARAAVRRHVELAAALRLRADHRGPVDNLRYMVLPVLTLAIGEAAYIPRTTRGAIEDALAKPYVAVPARQGRHRAQPRLPPRAAQRRRADRHGRSASSSACCSAARS